TTKIVKMALSAAIKLNMPTRPRSGLAVLCSGVRAMVAVLMDVGGGYSYFQSGSPGCLMSQSGRRLLTTGGLVKLNSGGGDVVDHSSVQASHGSRPARFPLRSDQRMLATKHRIPRALIA